MQPKLFVLVVLPQRAFPVELPAGRAVVIGRGPGAQVTIEDPRVAPRQLTLSAREDGVLIEPLGGTGGTLLNEVQLSAAVVARPGDELAVGDARLIFLGGASTAQGRPRLAGHDELSSRLQDETLRAGAQRSVALVLVAMPPLNTPARLALLRRLSDATALVQPATCWGELTSEVLAAVVPELAVPALKALLARLPEVAGPRAKVVSAFSPVDGIDAESLIERALERLEPEEDWPPEPVMSEPVMVRLFGAAERLRDRAPSEHAKDGWAAVEGPPGSGRATFARVLGGSGARAVHAADTEGLERAIAGLNGGTLVVREAGVRAAEVLQRVLEQAKGRLLVTLEPHQHPELFGVRLKIPALADRPADVLPLADHFLSLVRTRLARPRLVLSDEAQGLFVRYRWPGNVRELKNVVTRAARAALRDEIGRDALPERLTHEAPVDSLRGALKATERELFLEALGRTRWNVTAAATRLGLPRRTVVYRMSRLGLKRPAR